MQHGAKAKNSPADLACTYTFCTSLSFLPEALTKHHVDTVFFLPRPAKKHFNVNLLYIQNKITLKQCYA